MNWDQIKSDWKAVSDKIKRAWARLSEDDLTAIAGQRDEFARLLHVRYGYDKALALNTVDQFAEWLNPYWSLGCRSTGINTY